MNRCIAINIALYVWKLGSYRGLGRSIAINKLVETILESALWLRISLRRILVLCYDLIHDKLRTVLHHSHSNFTWDFHLILIALNYMRWSLSISYMNADIGACIFVDSEQEFVRLVLLLMSYLCLYNVTNRCSAASLRFIPLSRDTGHRTSSPPPDIPTYR